MREKISFYVLKVDCDGAGDFTYFKEFAYALDGEETLVDTRDLREAWETYRELRADGLKVKLEKDFGVDVVKVPLEADIEYEMRI